jgi:non-homologous end joining protein Ku
VIDLEKCVPRCDIDPVYFDSPYYLYPDDPIAVETLRVIGAAMAEAGVVGLDASRCAGASGWSWLNRAVPEWR